MGDYQVSTTNIEIELRSPTLVNLTKFARTGKILKGSCQNHSGIGFTMYYLYNLCFILFDREFSHHAWSCYLCTCWIGHVNELDIAFNCSCIGHVCSIAHQLVIHVHTSCALWLHMRDSDTIPTRNGRELGEIWVSKVGTNF